MELEKNLLKVERKFYYTNWFIIGMFFLGWTLITFLIGCVCLIKRNKIYRGSVKEIIKHNEQLNNREVQIKKNEKISASKIEEEQRLSAESLKKESEQKHNALHEELSEKRKIQEEKINNDLNNFVNNYLDESYIERRDNVLLENLNYTPIEYRYDVSFTYKEKIKELEEKEKSLIKQTAYVTGTFLSKKSENTKFENMVVSGFNAITDKEISATSIKNYEQKKKKLRTVYEQFNSALAPLTANGGINKLVLEYKLAKLDLMLEYKQLVEEEKEILREQKAREKEEKKLQMVIEKEIGKIEKEKEKISLQKEVYFERMEAEEDPNIKEAILKEINELQVAIDELNSSENTLEEKKKLTAAGHVYVISNIGSFGEDVYKIGMTRRNEPMDRVKELGDASVPFTFDTHALIYSKNAYELENLLHKEFEQFRVNKVNKRKEYFKVKLEDIKRVVLENYNGTVEFIETPEAIEYRETLLLEKEA